MCGPAGRPTSSSAACSRRYTRRKIGTRTAVVKVVSVTSDAAVYREAGAEPVGEGGTSDVAAELSSASAIDRSGWRTQSTHGRRFGPPSSRRAGGGWIGGCAIRIGAAAAAGLGRDGGPPIVAARSSDRLLIASAAPAANLVTPLLLRSIANATVDRQTSRGDEVVPIADSMLQRWSCRPAG